MKQNKKWLAPLALLCLLLLLSGCGSHYEPDALSYVLLIGIDEGTQNTLRVSFMIANPKELAGGSGAQSGTGGGNEIKGTASPVATVESPSLYAAMNMVNTFVGRKISLMHAKGIIFSEKMARDGSMALFIPALTQYRETRGTAFLAVTKDKPEKILQEMKPLLEANPAKYIELLAATSQYTGFIPSIQLQEFYNESKVEGIAPVSILFASSKHKLSEDGKGNFRREGAYVAGQMSKKGGVALEAMGAAVFRDGVMVGELTGDETTLQAMLRGKFKRGIFSMEDPLKPKNILSMDVVSARKPKIKVSLTNQGAVIDVKISLEGNLLGATSTIDYALPKYRPILEKAFADMIQKQAEDLVIKTQQEYKADILGFGTKARHLVLTQKQWQNLKWRELYEQAEVNVEVDYKLRRTGNLLRIMPLVKPEQGIDEGDNPQ